MPELWSGRCCYCKRPLNDPFDALSADCGGDCWGCLGEMEADMGYGPSIMSVNAEFRAGLRPRMTEEYYLEDVK